MTREEQIQICRQCLNRDFDPSLGLICGITLTRAKFQGHCLSYLEDYDESARIVQNDMYAQKDDKIADLHTFENWAIRNGFTGGIVLLVVAFIWFMFELNVDHISIHPFILMILGLGALANAAYERDIDRKSKKQNKKNQI